MCACVHEGWFLKMHIFHKTQKETERGEKRKIQPVCVVSVGLTSDLAEYGKEESVESPLCVGDPLSLSVCARACVCVLWPVCVLISVWVVRGGRKGIGCV